MKISFGTPAARNSMTSHLAVILLLTSSHLGMAQDENTPKLKPDVGKGDLVKIGLGDGQVLSRVLLEHKVFSPDKRLFAGFYQDGWDETISIHDAVSGKQIRRITGHGDFVTKFKFSDDGKLLSSWEPRDDEWKIWEVSTGKLLLTLSTFGAEKKDAPIKITPSSAQNGSAQNTDATESEPKGSNKPKAK